MNETPLCLGVMSGSSLDGLDLALVRYAGRDKATLEWDVIALQQTDIPHKISQKLSTSDTLPAIELFALDVEFGREMGTICRDWCASLDIRPDIVAVHGHTVFHEPKKSFSVQLGSGAHIAHECGFSVITGIRYMDMAAGGKGAPYAPLADRAMFQGYDAWINLGGIANISAEVGSMQLARDVVICNQLLNRLAEREHLRFDAEGHLARKGRVIEPLIRDLSTLNPKMDLAEAMSNQWVLQELALPFLQSRENAMDLLATAVEWIAECLVRRLKLWFPGPETAAKVLMSGGGVHNTYLMQRLTALAGSRFELVIPAREVIDFKEAILMSYLGYLCLTHTPAPLAHTTGAVRNHIQGALWQVSKGIDS